MSYIVNLIKAANAPKTEDTRFDDASAALQGCAVEPAELRDPLLALVRKLNRLASASTKLSTDIGAWIAEGGQEGHPTLGFASALLARVVSEFESQTDPLFASRLAPTFFEPIAAYERAVADVERVRANRAKAVADFDRDRELLRLVEAAKKPKQADIDKARQRCEDSSARYDAANDAFVAAVAQLTAARPATLLLPFKQLLAVWVAYVRRIAPAPEAGRRRESEGAKASAAAEAAATRGSPFDDDSAGRLLDSARSYSQMDRLDFARGGWTEERVGFAVPPPPRGCDGTALVDPFEEADPSAWEAQFAAAKLADNGDELGADPFG
jgi:hypothetical protein